MSASLGIGVADLIIDYLENRKKKQNELLDSRKDVIYFSDGTWKEQYYIHERRND